MSWFLFISITLTLLASAGTLGLNYVTGAKIRDRIEKATRGSLELSKWDSSRNVTQYFYISLVRFSNDYLSAYGFATPRDSPGYLHPRFLDLLCSHTWQKKKGETKSKSDSL
jgi:hypothetical protein